VIRILLSHTNSIQLTHKSDETSFLADQRTFCIKFDYYLHFIIDNTSSNILNLAEHFGQKLHAIRTSFDVAPSRLMII
jgi:hypothetical protein